jgi:hypothetical protein
MKMRKSCVVILILLLTASAASNSHAFCRGKPLPEKRWFFLLESGWKWRVAESNIRADKKDWLFTADWGYMRNLNRKSSLGATLFVGADDDAGQFGIRPRYRVWLDRQVSLDLSPGIIFAGDDNHADLKFPGFVATASIGIGDRFAFSLQYQAIRFAPLPSMYPDRLPPPGTQSALYMGPTFGSWAAIAWPVVMMIIYASEGE